MQDISPQFFERLEKIYTTSTQRVIDALSQPRQKTIRTNTLKTNDAELISSLENIQVRLKPVDTIPHAFEVMSSSLAISQTPLYSQGLFYIQGLSSQLTSIILDPQKEELILDMAASPGSKTSHIAALMENTGTIVANDISWDRLSKLKSVLTQFGVTNVNPINFPGQTLWRDYQDTFDRVLCDAPCSMEGRIIFSDPKTFDNWSLKRIKELATRQKGLLRSAVRCAKPGTMIVYSTCTLAPEENEEVIDWILEKEEGSVEVVPVTWDGLETFPCLPEWEGSSYHPDISQCLRLLPSHVAEGFFIAKLRKIQS